MVRSSAVGALVKALQASCSAQGVACDPMMMSLCPGSCVRTFIGHTDWVTSVHANEVSVPLPLQDPLGGCQYAGGGSLPRTLPAPGCPLHALCLPRPLLLLGCPALRISPITSCPLPLAVSLYAPHCSSVPLIAPLTQASQIGMPPGTICMASASADASIKLWSVQTGEMLQEFRGHFDRVTCVKVHFGSVFSSSCDGSARRWDCRTGQQVMVSVVHLCVCVYVGGAMVRYGTM